MPAEPNEPKTNNIAFFTVASLILILVSCIALEGLYYIWEERAATIVDSGSMGSALQAYRQEQAEKLAKIGTAEAAVLKEAQAGKPLAIIVPTTPATPAKTPEKK
jgi:hypothetical protein